VVEVAVRLVAEGGYVFTVEGAREAFVVADHVLSLDVETALKPPDEAQAGRELAVVSENLSIAEADVLDPDRGPVQSDGVTTDRVERNQLVDCSLGVDEEVRAGARELVELDVGNISCEVANAEAKSESV
jgi:hypothetical protein